MATRAIAAGALALLLVAGCGSADTAEPTTAPTKTTVPITSNTTIATTAPTSATEPPVTPSTPTDSQPVTTPAPDTVTSAPTADTTAPDSDAAVPTSYGAPIDLGGTWAQDINTAGVIVGTLGGVSGEDAHGTVGQDDARAIWWPEPGSSPELLDVAPGELSFGWGVNDGGEILVRTGHPEAPTAALVVDPRRGVIAELPAPENGHAEAWAFNDSGEVLVSLRQGWEQPYSTFVVWDAHTGAIQVPPGLDGQEYVLSDINNGGDVVGHVLAPFGGPFVWDRIQNVLHYLDLGLAEQGYGSALNDHGQVVGLVRANAQAPDRAAVWNDYSSPPLLFDDCARFHDVSNTGQVLCGNQVWQLGSNEVAQLSAVTGNVAAINDHGQVVGGSDGHAALWDPS